MTTCVAAVAVFLLFLALVNVLFLHSHMHNYSDKSNLVSKSVVQTTPKNAAISMQSLLEMNEAASFFDGDIQTCPELPQTACFETTYTIVAVCLGDRLYILVQKVLQWMHDPSVHQIYLLFPSDVRNALAQDPHYGARLLHWENQQSIKLLFSDSLAKALHALHLSSEAFIWVPEPHALVSNQNIREAYQLWKSDASRPVLISSSDTRQWFVLHKKWLCSSQFMTNQNKDAWDMSTLQDVFSLVSDGSKGTSSNAC